MNLREEHKLGRALFYRWRVNRRRPRLCCNGCGSPRNFLVYRLACRRSDAIRTCYWIFSSMLTDIFARRYSAVPIWEFHNDGCPCIAAGAGQRNCGFDSRVCG